MEPRDADLAREAARNALVVGAGPAGLAATYELRRAGIDAMILERGTRAGEAWRARHEDLRLNTIRWLSGLPGSPMPARFGRWVGRDDYVAYLEDYAKLNDLSIEFDVEVRRIDRVGSVWQLDTTRGARRAGDVVIATGHDRIPAVPVWPGAAAFRGEIRHVASVVRPRDFTGQDVLVVGGGNSGVEWVEHLVRIGAHSVWLSVRRPPNLVPRFSTTPT
ncbi:MAG TPA: NAD(P)/FAD-dependent oxidoreductase [Candidatus Limnocylindrales bacterium]